MLNWKDRKYVNPRKKVFKNLDTNEILNLEIQDDPDNILEESETPLTAHNLNLAQAELVDDIGTQTQSEREVLTLEEAIQENTEYEIPVTYEVGNNSLEIYYQGTKLIKGIEYLEVGTEGTFSNKIKFHNWGQNVPVGRTIEFIVRGTILTKAITSEETKAQIEIIKAEQTEQNTNIEANANEIEAIKQENALLRSQIPQGSAEGEYITLNDSSNLPFDEFNIGGNSKQATRDGRNLYNYADAKIISEGVTVDDDGWITITCDNTNGTTKKYLNYFTNNLNLETDTNYNIIAEVKNVNGTGAIHFISAVPTEKQFETGFYKLFSNIANNNVYNSINKTLTTALGNYGLRTFAVYEIGQSGSITFRLSVLKDTTITPESFKYEPYGAMPSPEFPSDIRNCGDDVNLFEFSNDFIGSITLSNYITNNNDGTFTTTGLSGLITAITKTFKPGTYTISILPFDGYSLGSIYIRNTGGTNVTSSFTFTVTETNTMSFDIRVYDIITKFYIKIQEGTVATPWSPYGCGNINIKTSNANLWNDNEAMLENCITYSNGIYSASDNDTRTPLQYKIQQYSKDNKFLGANTQTTKIINNIGRYYFTSTKVENAETVRIKDNGAVREFDLRYFLDDIKVGEKFTVVLNIIDTTIGASKFKDVMLLKGEVTEANYIEHEGQTHTIYTKKPFRKVDNTKDTFIKKTKWNERHYIKRLIFDGTENCYKSNTNGTITAFYLIKDDIKLNSVILSNYFKYYQVNNILNAINVGITVHNSLPRIYIAIDEINNATDFKSYLAEQYANGTPVYVDYILETPEDIECTEEQTNQLNELLNSGTYKNVTHICSLDEIKPTFEVKYRKDLETLLGGVVA